MEEDLYELLSAVEEGDLGEWDVDDYFVGTRLLFGLRSYTRFLLGKLISRGTKRFKTDGFLGFVSSKLPIEPSTLKQYRWVWDKLEGLDERFFYSGLPFSVFREAASQEDAEQYIKDKIKEYYGN